MFCECTKSNFRPSNSSSASPSTNHTPNPHTVPSDPNVLSRFCPLVGGMLAAAMTLLAALVLLAPMLSSCPLLQRMRRAAWTRAFENMDDSKSVRPEVYLLISLPRLVCAAWRMALRDEGERGGGCG